MKTRISENLKEYFYWMRVIVIGIVLGISLQFVRAWTEPTLPAPGGNVSGPINVSAIGQSKTGGLILNTGGAVNGLIVAAGKVGIGTVNPQYKLDVIASADAVIGIAGSTSFTNGTGVYGVATTGGGSGVHGYYSGTSNGTGISGTADKSSGFGVYGSNGSTGIGIVGQATAGGTGVQGTGTYGVKGYTNKESGVGIAGYGNSVGHLGTGIYSIGGASGYDFYGDGPKSYFAGKVGIGTTNPSQKLEVAGIIKSNTGGIMFPDNTVQTTAAGASTARTTSYTTKGDLGVHTFCALNIVQNGWNTSIGNNDVRVTGVAGGNWTLSGAADAGRIGAVCLDFN